MSFDDGLGMIVEGDENTLGVFPGAFIFEGDPEVFRSNQYFLRMSMSGLWKGSGMVMW